MQWRSPGPNPNDTMRSESGAATGLSKTAVTTEKIAVLAPIPSVDAATAASVRAGALSPTRESQVAHQLVYGNA